MKLVTEVFLVFAFIITQVKCRETLCPGITQSNACNCSANINGYYHIYTLQCPKTKTFTKQPFEFEIYTSSYESRLTISCNSNAISNLIDTPLISSNLTKFKAIYFNNCFKNGSIPSTKVQDDFNLNEFLNRINAKLDVLMLRLVFNEFSYIDDNQFFSNFTFHKYFSVIIKNIGFSHNRSNYIGEQKLFFVNLLNSKHIELVNNYEIDFNHFAGNTTLMTIEIEKNRILNLNKKNLSKFSMLYKFQMIDCRVINGHDLSGEEKLFANNILIELIMKNITVQGCTNADARCELVFNENLLVGIKRLRILTITNNNELYQLPANFFSSLNDLFTVDLSGNKLHSLDRDMFKYNLELHVLNLTGNKFVVFDDNQIFQQIKSLRKLYLNSNLLTKFYYNATGQNYLNELHLHNNQLSYDDDIICPFSNISLRIKINLSSNNITKADALIDCFISIEGLTELNLENNRIQDVKLKPLTTSTVVLERLFDNLFLANNNVTNIDILDEVDWDLFAGQYKKTNLIVDLDLNPLFCENCFLLKQVLNHSYVPVTSDFGTVIRFQHPHKCKLNVFCDEQIFYDHDYKCPKSCSCRYNEFTRIVLVECINKGLTEFPVIDFIQTIAVDAFIINFSGNNITEFTTKGQNPEVFKRLKSINLENNSIKTFTLSLLYNKVDEILLQNNQLQITNDFLKQFNDREILVPQLKMTLSGNEYCNHFDDVTHLFDAINFNLVDDDFIDCTPITTEMSTMQANIRKNTGIGRFWSIPVFLLMVACFVGYVYYRSQVRETTARFINRLRYRKANSEFESNLIQDDS